MQLITAVGLVIALAAPPALAQPKTTNKSTVAAAVAPKAAPTLSESLTGTAKAEYDAAKILYDDGDYQGAYTKLKAAYDAAKDPRLLWNMAACEKNQRHYAAVAKLVDRYLVEGGALLGEADRKEATELVNTVKGFVSELTLQVDQPGASVFIDEQPVGTSPLPGPVQVDMGARKIRITKAGFREFALTAELAGGQPSLVSATLTPEVHEGRLRVVAGPGDVIQVDRKLSKVGLWEGVLPSGTHSVYVSAKGKRPHQTDVVVQDNDLTNLHVALEDEPKAPIIEKSGVPTWVWVAGGAVLVGGGVGSYFLLKSDSSSGKYESPKLGTWGEIPL